MENDEQGAQDPQEGDAAPAQEDGQQAQQGGGDDAATQDGGARYTDADVDEIVQNRLKREREKWEREVEDQKAKATEAERLKSMTELERAQYEARRLKERNDQLEREHNIAEQTAVARKSLAEAGIEVGDGMLSMIVGDDADATKAAIDEFKAVWPKALDEAVKSVLARKASKMPSGKGEPESFGARFAKQYNESRK